MFGKDKQETNALPENTVMGNFQYSAQLPNGKSIVMSGYMVSGESVESLNDRLDIVQAVIERQRVRLEVPVLEHAREMIVQQTRDLEANVKGQEDALAKLKDRKLKGAKLTSQEQMHMNTLTTNITNAAISVKANEERLAAADKSISEAKQKAGMEKAA